jgi:carbamate kinase
VVPSPRPLEVLGLEAVRELLRRGRLVIAGGGGGIPVVRGADGSIAGIEAVIDKDRTAALLARELRADLLVILTGVPCVMRDFGRKNARPLPVLPVRLAKRLLAQGQFPPGSMGPKIEAAVEYVEATGRRALITDIEHLAAALRGEAGTVVERDAPRRRRRRAGGP